MGHLSRIEPVPYDTSIEDAWKEWIPAPCICFSHGGIDSRVIFKHDAHGAHSVYETRRLFALRMYQSRGNKYIEDDILGLTGLLPATS